MDCIKANFDQIISAINSCKLRRSLPVDGNLLQLRPGPKPKFTDIDVIALSLTAESMGYDSENYLFAILNSRYKNDFPNLISRRQFNDRRKNLFYFIEDIRLAIASFLNELTEVYAIDSMPVPICKLVRFGRNKRWFNNDLTAPNVGRNASQEVYFGGYKLHALCSPSGVIQNFDLTKATVHDVKYLSDIKCLISNCIITGDRGYVSQKVHDDLWQTSKICMEVPSRGNQKQKKKVMKVLRIIRKRIETVFSQLCGQFNIQRNYAKSFTGFRVRILSKVTAMTVLQFINKLKGNKISQIKYAFR